jgi:hypothetical protein
MLHSGFWFVKLNATCQIVKGVARQLQPTVRRFVELGMQRVWMRGGEVCFQKGAAATELFVIVSGRLRLVPSTEKDGKVCVSVVGKFWFACLLHIASHTFVSIKGWVLFVFSSCRP